MDLYCSKHSLTLEHSGENGGGCVPGCLHYVVKDFINDFIVDEVEDVWSDMWQRKGGVFKRALDFFLSSFVTEYLCGEARDIVLKRIAPGATIAEIGCGEAMTSALIRKHVDARVVMVDGDISALRLAHSRMGVKDMTYVRTNIAQALPFKEKTFDACYNVGTIEHFQDPVSVVKEMARIGRTVVCSVPAPGSPYWKTGTFLRTLIEEDATLWTENTRYYTAEQLGDIFHRAGLRNIAIVPTNLVGFPVHLTAVGES